MTLIKKFIALGATATAMALSPAALAQEAEDVVVSGNSVIVSFGDLNLSSDRGIEILDLRIRHAVQTVCGGPAESNVAFGGPMRQCQRETMARVQPARDRILASVNNPDGPQLAATALEIRRDQS